MQTASQISASQFDAIFADLDQSCLPGAAVGVAIEGTPVYRKAFGLANMELPVVLSPTMRMRIGSVTKHFTALAFLLLCEEGRAGLDEPLGSVLPDLHPVTHRITPRQLMSHTSGLRDVHDIAWRFSGTGRPISSEELLSLYREIDDVSCPPDATWSYNNGGYLLLSAIIERISGRCLAEVLRARIFDPVGMRDTLLRPVDTDFIPGSATLHTKRPAGGFEKAYLGTSLSGEGGVVSTVDDMLRWLAHMDAPTVGTRTTWKLLKTPYVLSNGMSTDYGCGLFVGRHGEVPTVGHSGGVMGGNSHMVKAGNLDVVVMTNRDDVSASTYAQRVLDLCLGPVAAGSKEAGGVIATGTFHSPTTHRTIQLCEKHNRQIVSVDGYDLPFSRGSDGVLRPTGEWAFLKQFVVLGDDARAPATIRFNDFGNWDELVRVQAPAAMECAPIVGRYRSAGTHTDFLISDCSGQPLLTTAGQYGSTVYQLECLGERLWRAQCASSVFAVAVLFFHVGAEWVRVSTMRSRELIFRRYA